MLLMRKTIIAAGLGLLIMAGLVACSGGDNKSTPNQQELAAAENERFNHFLDSVFQRDLHDSPQWLSQMGKKDRQHELNDITEAGREKRMQWAQADLAALGSFQQELLTEDAMLSFRLKEYDLNQKIEGYEWRHHTYWVNQMHGMQSGLPAFMLNAHKIDNLEDAQAYLDRLAAFRMQFAQLITNIQLSQAKGIVPPKFVFPMVVADCENVIGDVDAPESNLFYTDFSSKLEKLELPDADRDALLADAIQQITASVIPAYSDLILFMGELETVATAEDGVWKFPEGEQFYAYRLKKITSTDLTPEDIFTTGEAEVERIHNEMRDIMTQVGFEGDLQAFFEFMRTDDQFYAEESEAGKQEMLDGYMDIVNAMEQRLDELFITKPKARMEVRAVEPYREQSAGKAFYARGTPDGSRPGVFYANLYRTRDMPTYEMEALAYHEGIPGHHMQISIAQELTDIPEFRKHLGHTAYVEGWGLYCEQLPKEIGFYSDPYSDFGRLAMELWRACRLVVDVGLHSKQWTREQAIEYLEANTPAPPNQCRKAIERYIVMPGQATAYKIGMIRILNAREQAKKAMGEQFNLPGFHDVVLRSGPLPIFMMEERIQAWAGKAAS